MSSCVSALKSLEEGIVGVRNKVLNLTDQLGRVSKNSLKKTKGVIYQRNNEYYAKWTTIPAKLIAEFQATKECPLQVYREMRQAVITNPEKLSHDYAIKLIRRYKEALPDDTARSIVKEYLTRRLEELRKLADKDIYTKAVLLKFMASVMSDEDAYTIECYLEANNRSVSMREMANSVLRNRMQTLLRQSTLTKPTDQMLPLNPTNRQHQLLHKLAVEEKALPKTMRAQTAPKRPFNRAFGNNARGQGFQRRQNRRHNGNQNGNGSFNPSAQAAAPRNHQNQNRQFAGTQRPNMRAGPRNTNGSRGQGANATNGNNTNASKSLSIQQPAASAAEAVNQLKASYDYSKIADKLDHFGNTTADVQLMLQHQLVQRGINVAPNPKKEPKKPNLEQ